MIDTFAIRCSILRLALSGKLSEQKETDGTAKELLSRVTRINNEQDVGAPYQIPESWSWVKLGDLYKINPKVEADDNADAAFIPMDKISAGFDRSFTYETQIWEKASKNHTKFADEDVAFAKITPCFENRKSFIARDLPNGIGGGTTELIILRQKEMLPEYTYLLILDQRFINTGTASYKGSVGQQRVQSDVIKNYLIPVPPIAEQQRIVDRVQQAFTALDTIDELQTQYSDNLTVLKSKLIDAAIQGKLTEQLPEDGTAEELYQQIQEEKQALIKAGKIKKEKPLPAIKMNEIPFEIPANWKWCRVEDILLSIGSGKSIRCNESVPDDNTPGIIKVSAVTWGSFQENESKTCLSDSDWNEDYSIHSGDFLISRANTRKLVGACVIVDKIRKKLMLSDKILRITFSEKIDSQFMLKVMRSSILRNQIEAVATGTSDSMNNISQKEIRGFLIPLPPIAEQKRIVARLDQVLAMIEV